MLNIKSVLVGAVLAFAGVLAGEGLAHAESCDYAPTAVAVDHEAYELAFSLAEETCDHAAQGWIEDGLTEEQVGGFSGMYEACMRLSVPPMILAPAQHYDTTDGAFWRTVQP